MAEGEIEKPGTPLIIFGLAMFLGLAVFAAYFLWTGSATLLTGITSEANVITFKKGAMYGLGGAPGLLVMFYMVLRSAFGFSMTEKERTIGGWILVVSVFVLLIFPHIAEVAVNLYVENQGYEKCELLSRQWLHDKTVIYTITPEFCREP